MDCFIGRTFIIVAMADSLPWYQDGLRFECTGCGKCCTGAPGYIWVTLEEIEAIAARVGLPVEQFTRKYVRRIGNEYSLIEKRNSKGEYDCIFLDGKRCQIYEERPTQCRTFPFWKENLESPEAWNELRTTCEGIHDQAALVPLEQIVTQRDAS
jgi:uncharacterized protein